MIVAAHWGGSLHAQTQQQVDACEGKGNPPLDTVITNCTALVQSGHYAGRDLSTVFVIRATAYQRKGELERSRPKGGAVEGPRLVDASTKQVPPLRLATLGSGRDDGEIGQMR
jgi:hypothetical protein